MVQLVFKKAKINYVAQRSMKALKYITSQRINIDLKAVFPLRFSLKSILILKK